MSRSGFAIIPAEVRKNSASIGPAAVQVYVHLAFFADRNGRCWPSHDTLTQETGLSPRTLIRAITALEEAGLLEVHRSIGQPNRYLLTSAKKDSGTSAKKATSKFGTSAKKDSGPVPNMTVDQCQKGQSNKNQEQEPRTRTNALAHEFANWWKIYPRKADRGKAAKAYPKAIKAIAKGRKVTEKEAAEWLLSITERFAASDKGRSGRYCPYGATWLNGERYLDDPATWQDDKPQGRQARQASYDLEEVCR